jgi:osmotically-inducible protein OsmY
VDELFWDSGLNAKHISIRVLNGRVTLTGTVQYYAEKIAAEKAVKRVKGVKDIAQSIELLVINNDASQTDGEITEAVLNALEATSLLIRQLTVNVIEGWVIMQGEVDSLSQKCSTEGIIGFLKGIKGISNQICVKPTMITESIVENIREAYVRNADLFADQIKIEAQGSKVILRGTARSWLQKKEVERVTASAPGVTEIEDQLAIFYQEA